MNKAQQLAAMQAVYEASGKTDWDDLYYGEYPYTDSDLQQVMARLEQAVQKVQSILSPVPVKMELKDRILVMEQLWRAEGQSDWRYLWYGEYPYNQVEQERILSRLGVAADQLYQEHGDALLETENLTRIGSRLGIR